MNVFCANCVPGTLGPNRGLNRKTGFEVKGWKANGDGSDLSPFETYLVCIPAIVLGSILLLGGIILLLEPRKKTDAETLAEIRKALERPGDEFARNRPEDNRG